MAVMLSLFDKSTVMARPWAEAGYDCYCYDLQHPLDVVAENVGAGRIWRVGMDLRNWRCIEGGPADFVAAFPPCDHLSVSGARWFQGKGLRKLADAIELVAVAAEVCESYGVPYMIENPVSTLATYWRKPDYTFDPCDYGDPYTKRTCLWTGNGFVMPPKNRIEPTEGSKMHLMAPGPDRKDKRSETPRGFARAVFEANAKVLV